MDSRSQQMSEQAGQAQAKRDDAMNSQQQQQDSYTEKATSFLQQTGEQVKNMAVGAADAVKNTLGMNNADNNSSNASNNNSSNPSNPSNNNSSLHTTNLSAPATTISAAAPITQPSNPSSNKM